MFFSVHPPYLVVCPSSHCQEETDILAIDFFDWQECVYHRKVRVAFQYGLSLA
jgi:hypothetical protein